MNNKHDEESRLQALFDRTAAEPSREQLARLARLAAQIPERRPRSALGWLRQRWWSPLALAFAAATVAALALIATRDVAPEGPRADAPARAETQPTAPAPEPLDPLWTEPELAELEAALAELEAEPPESEALLSDNPLAALALDGDGAAPLGALDALLEPEDDDALAAWVAALERIAGGT